MRLFQNVFLTIFLFLIFVTDAIARCQISDLGEPLQRFISDEQSWEAYGWPDDGSEIESVLRRWDSPYSPVHKPVFEILGCWINVDAFKRVGNVELFGSEGPIRSQFLRHGSDDSAKEEVLFFVHPDATPTYGELGIRFPDIASRCLNYCATPTTSNRTLVVWSPDRDKSFNPVMIKTSISANIGGRVKAIFNSEAKESVQINDALEKQKIQRSGPMSFNYMAEPFAVAFQPQAPDSMSSLSDAAQVFLQEGAGMIVRAIPDEVLKVRHLVSGIAFYGDPAQKDGQDPYLLKAMAGRNEEEVYRVLREYVIRPFVQELLKHYFEQGILPEPHGQNLLIELDEKGFPTGRFWHRDLYGVKMEGGIRAIRRLPLGPVLKNPAERIHNIQAKFGLFLLQMGQALEKWKRTGSIKSSGEGTATEILALFFYEELTSQLSERLGFRARVSDWVRKVVHIKYEKDHPGRGVHAALIVNYEKNLASVVHSAARMKALDWQAENHCDSSFNAHEDINDLRSLYSFGFRLEDLSIRSAGCSVGPGVGCEETKKEPALMKGPKNRCEIELEKERSISLKRIATSKKRDPMTIFSPTRSSRDN